MSFTIIGTCGRCGGPVAVPIAWFGVIPPVPTCRHCGAVAAMHGPVIPMMDNPNQCQTRNWTSSEGKQ